MTLVDPSCLNFLLQSLKYSSAFIRLIGFKRSNFLRYEKGQYKKNIKEKILLPKWKGKDHLASLLCYLFMRNSTFNPVRDGGRALMPSPWGHLHAELTSLSCHLWQGWWREDDTDERHFRGFRGAEETEHKGEPRLAQREGTTTLQSGCLFCLLPSFPHFCYKLYSVSLCSSCISYFYITITTYLRGRERTTFAHCFRDVSPS